MGTSSSKLSEIEDQLSTGDIVYLLGTQKCSFTLEMCNLLFKPGGLPHAYSPPFSLSPSDGSIQSKYLFKSDRLGWVRAAKVGFLVSYFSSDFSFRNELPKFDHQQTARNRAYPLHAHILICCKFASTLTHFSHLPPPPLSQNFPTGT